MCSRWLLLFLVWQPKVVQIKTAVPIGTSYPDPIACTYSCIFRYFKKVNRLQAHCLIVASLLGTLSHCHEYQVAYVFR